MKKGLNALGVLLSIIVIIALLGLELMLGVKLPTKKTMEIENLSSIMEEIDIERIFRDEKGNEKPAGTRIYHYFSDIGLPREDVDEVVKDKSFKKIIGNYLATMFMNGIDGTEVIYPRKSELVSFIHRNYNAFQKVTEFPKDYKQEKIEEIVNDNYGNVKYELEELAKDINFNDIKEVEIVTKILSTSTILLIGGVILCIVLLVIFRHSFYKWLKWASIPTIISGLICLGVGLIGKSLIIPRVNLGKYEFFLKLIAENIIKNVAIYGALLLGLGLVLIIIHAVIKKTVSKKVKITIEGKEEPVEEPEEVEETVEEEKEEEV